jgi:hypothetical protein
LPSASGCSSLLDWRENVLQMNVDWFQFKQFHIWLWRDHTAQA